MAPRCDPPVFGVFFLRRVYDRVSLVPLHRISVSYQQVNYEDISIACGVLGHLQKKEYLIDFVAVPQPDWISHLH